MNELCSYFDPGDLNALPESIRAKLNEMMQLSAQSIMKLQNNFSQSSMAYENAILQLNKNLQEQNQKYYELEMITLKMKTSVRRNEKEDHLKVKTCNSKHVIILKKKISALIEKNKELILKNDGLNSQIEFIIQNKDVDSQELCHIASSYISELNELKSAINSSDNASIKNLKSELEVLRSNEKEYQEHIYDKTREVYDFQNRVVTLETENNLLQQYRQKYDNLYTEYVRTSAVLNEAKHKNFEFKKILKSQNESSAVLNELENVKFSQSEATWKINKIFESLQNGSKVENIDAALHPIRSDLNRMNLYFNDLLKLKNKLGQILSSTFELIESKNLQIDEKQRHIDQFYSKEGPVSAEFDLLKKENQIMSDRLNSMKPESDILVENESFVIRNDQLLLELDSLRNQNKSLTDLKESLLAEIEILKKEETEYKKKAASLKNDNIELKHDNKVYKKEATESKQTVEELLIKISHLENEINKMDDDKYYESCKREKSNDDKGYIMDLKNELDLYKKDIHSISTQFAEYKKLYESFSIDNNNENIPIMKMNIEKKNTLIDSLYTLNAKYSEIIEILSGNK